MEYIYYYLMTNSFAINTGLIVSGSILFIGSLMAILGEIETRKAEILVIRMLFLGIFLLFLFTIFPTKEYFQYLINKG